MTDLQTPEVPAELDPLEQKLEEVHQEAKAQLERLMPLVTKYRRIVEMFEGTGPSPAPRRAGRPRNTGSTGSTAPESANGKLQRKDQALKLIRENPGITIPVLAEKMGLSGPTYLYRIMPKLEQESAVRRDGSNFFAIEGAS